MFWSNVRTEGDLGKRFILGTSLGDAKVLSVAKIWCGVRSSPSIQLGLPFVSNGRTEV